MQAGYRTKPAESAKALKARVKNAKLDNALYGSDVKYERLIGDMSKPESLYATTGTQTGQSTGAQTDISIKPSSTDALTQKKASVADVSIDSAVSNIVAPRNTPATIISPSQTNKTLSSVADQLNQLLMQGKLKPSEFKSANKKTTATTDQNVAKSEQSVETVEQKGPLPTIDIPSAKPLTQAPVNTPPIKLREEFDNLPRNDDGTITPSNSPKKQAAESKIETTTAEQSSEPKVGDVIPEEYIDANGLSPEQDQQLQKTAFEIFDNNPSTKDAPSSRNYDDKWIKIKMPFYKWEKDAAHVFRIAKIDDGWIKYKNSTKNPRGKVHFVAIKSTGSSLTNQSVYALNYSLAKYKENMPALVGQGLESTDGKVIWKHRRADGNPKAKFVLIGPYMKGNIKYYGSSKKPASISVNNASPAFLRIVKDVIENGTFSTADYNAVDPKESLDVNEFIRFTKPLIPNGTHFNAGNASDVYELRKRYQVLVGELSAGNQGQMIKDEMIGILRDLHRLKALSLSKVQSLIKGLKEL